MYLDWWFNIQGCSQRRAGGLSPLSQKLSPLPPWFLQMKWHFVQGLWRAAILESRSAAPSLGLCSPLILESLAKPLSIHYAISKLSCRGAGNDYLNATFRVKRSHRFTRDFTNTDPKIRKWLLYYVKNYFNRTSVEVQPCTPLEIMLNGFCLNIIW